MQNMFTILCSKCWDKGCKCTRIDTKKLEFISFGFDAYGLELYLFVRTGEQNIMCCEMMYYGRTKTVIIY